MSGYRFDFDGHGTFDPDGKVENPNPQLNPHEHNTQLAEAEVATFQGRASDRWFGYWRNDEPRTIQTWTGAPLATVTWQGREFQSPGFGCCSTRVNFRARGIDGRNWAGTYYKSSGDYVRMRVVKS